MKDENQLENPKRNNRSAYSESQKYPKQDSQLDRCNEEII